MKDRVVFGKGETVMATSKALSVTNIAAMAESFQKNFSDDTMGELDAFLGSDELRYLPLKAFRYYASICAWVPTIQVYLNQQDKINLNGPFHAWMRKMCGLAC
jgi:hypothetical protein